MPDYNIETALRWANELGHPPSLPSSLSTDVEHRANVVNLINTPLITDPQQPPESPRQLDKLSNEKKQQRLSLLVAESRNLIHDTADGNTRVNIILRLWSGCLAAAKTIALETKDGPNDPAIRARIFKDIDSLTLTDSVFSGGVEAAPAFKKLQKQHYSFDGVPLSSVVRKHPNEYLIKK
jgi:hypothetical protein